MVIKPFTIIICCLSILVLSPICSAYDAQTEKLEKMYNAYFDRSVGGEIAPNLTNLIDMKMKLQMIKSLQDISTQQGIRVRTNGW